MALAIRAYGEMGSDYGDTYRVRIYEEAFVGSSFEFTLSDPGFTLDYQPDTNNLSSPLVPSVADIYIINNSSDVDTLLTDLAAKQQSDFYVTIERDTGSGYSDYWKGVIFQDEITDQDRPKPRTVVISATDGLQLLQATDYDFDNTVSATTNNPEHTPILTILKTCFDQAIDNSLWGASDDYIITSVDWWETDQTYASNTDPFADLVIDVTGFKEVKERSGVALFDGNYGPDVIDTEYLTCWEVIEQLALLFLCRVYQYNGAWHFEQIPLREGATTKRMKYVKALTSTYSAPNTYTTLDGTRKKSRVALNEQSFFPALKKVTVEQRPYATDFNNVQTLDGSNLSNSSTKTYGLFSDEFTTAASGGQVSQALFLQVEFKNSLVFAYVAGDWVQLNPNWYQLSIRCTVDIQIKLSDAYSSTVHYWDHDNGQWTTTNTTFVLSSYLSSLQRATTGSGNLAFGYLQGGKKVINTAYLPATGIVEITMDNLTPQQLISVAPASYSNIPSGDLTLNQGNVKLTLKTLLERGDTKFVYDVSNPNTGISDKEVYNYPTLFISDKSIGSGYIMYDNGSSIEVCDQWEVGTDANNLPLPSLLAQQRLALQSEPIEQYHGQVLFPEGYGEGIGFDSKFWLPHDYSFAAKSGVVNGSWFNVAMYGSLGTPTENPSDPISESGFAARSVPDSLGTSEMFERTQGLFYDTNNGEQIISSVATKGGVRRLTERITVSASGSDTLTDDQHKIYVTWSGGDGTHTITLPAATDGKEFVIISDDTITASRDVDIDPDGSETINGEASITITGEGRLVIEEIEGNWSAY